MENKAIESLTEETSVPEDARFVYARPGQLDVNGFTVRQIKESSLFSTTGGTNGTSRRAARSDHTHDYASSAQGALADSALQVDDVANTPLSGATEAPISSDWAYSHINNPGSHAATSISVSATPDNYTTASSSVEAHLAGIDDALIGMGASTFLGLTDTPANFSGQSLKYLRVNSGETGVEFTDGVAGASAFPDLTDTPADYTSQALKLLRVNATEDGVEFVSPSVGGVASFLDLDDTPAVYTSSANKVVTVNGAGNGLTFSWGMVDGVNVRDYGAVGNGVADDTIAIQNAVDSGASYIMFPAGTYKITATIIVPAGVTLIGIENRADCLITGSAVSGALIATSATVSGASSKPRISIANLTFSGACDYGVRMIYAQGFRLENVRFTFGVGDLTYDMVHVVACWDSMIINVSAYSEGGRAVLWLDADVHGLTVRDIHTAAETQYGIWSGVLNDGTWTASSASQNFFNLVLQRHELGLWIKRARAVNVLGLYTEVTKVPVRLGDETVAADKASGVVINAARQTIMDTSSLSHTPWGDNDTGAVEALNCVGVQFNGFQFDSVFSGAGYHIAYLKNAKGLSFNNCVRNNSALLDFENYIQLHHDAVHNNSVKLVGSGVNGNEEVWPQVGSYTHRNQIARVWMEDGIFNTDTLYLPQRKPDPTYAFSFTRYMVANAGTKQKVCQLRRSSDNDTQDFWLDVGALKTVAADTAIATWAGASTIYVVRWYNQADDTFYLDQPTAGSQPILELTGVDSQPAMSFDGATGRHLLMPDATLRPYKCTAFICAKHRDGTADDEYVIGSTTGTARFTLEAGNGDNSWGAGIGSNQEAGGAALSTSAVVHEIRVDNLENGSTVWDWRHRINKVSNKTSQTTTNGTVNSSSLALGTAIASPSYYAFDGHIAELEVYLYYMSDANCDTISQAMMDQFSI